jgi:hypothetical protein
MTPYMMLFANFALLTMSMEAFSTSAVKSASFSISKGFYKRSLEYTQSLNVCLCWLHPQ